MLDSVASWETVIVFESHAASLDNESGLASGWWDVDLSPKGEEQARDLGARYPADALAAVFCSDLRRAVRTAEIAFAGRRVVVHRDARLRECDYGELTRRPAAEVEGQRLAHVAAPFPGGESYKQATARVRAWLAETAPGFAGRTILVIGHRATFYALSHLIDAVPLRDIVAAPWRWQPGWKYHVQSGAAHRPTPGIGGSGN